MKILKKIFFYLIIINILIISNVYANNMKVFVEINKEKIIFHLINNKYKIISFDKKKIDEKKIEIDKENKRKDEIPKNDKKIFFSIPFIQIIQKKDSVKWDKLLNKIESFSIPEWVIERTPKQVYALFLPFPITMLNENNNFENTYGNILLVNWCARDENDAICLKLEMNKIKKIIESTNTFDYQRLFYKSGKSTIGKSNRVLISNLAKDIESITKKNNLKKINIHVMGFTDPEGETQNNYKLSKKRVTKFIEYFKKTSSNLDIEYHPYYWGELFSNKIFEKIPDQNYSYNRRVEIIISNKENWEDIGWVKMYQEECNDDPECKNNNLQKN